MIVVVGFMGAGKSTVGPLLAERLGLPFVDSDAVLVEHLGTSIPEYFRAHGELDFRARERETVLALLAGPESVLSLGGGALGTHEVREALAGHHVVHLDVDLDEALARIGDISSRPMLTSHDVTRLHADRHPVYERVATVSVTTRGRSPQEVVEQVAQALSAPDDGPRVVVVGPPGAGKSAVGALVADRLGTTWTSSDALVEERAGVPVSELFVDQGEARFREVERQACLDALAGRGVVELGGGSVVDPTVRAALRDRRVVFLDVGIADAARRLGFDAAAMVALLPRRSWIAHMQRLRPVYEELATWTVDTAGRSVQDVADQVVELVQGGTA